MDCVHCGWLTKSPPEGRMKGPFKSQWRRRFFVLYAPPRTVAAFPSSGSSAFLHYYESEKITKKKGSIDLDSCEELRDRLDSNYYRHLFSLRTRDHGNIRTYYLAADTEPEMDVWVDKLTQILDYKPDVSFPMMSPNSVQSVSTFRKSPAAYLSSYPRPENQRKICVGDASSNGPVSTMQSVLPATPRAVGIIAPSQSMLRENLAAMSPNAAVLSNERPVLTPKLRDQVPLNRPHSKDSGNTESANDDDDDDDDDEEDVYNYPRQDFSSSAGTDHQQYDGETYDSPSRFTQCHQHVADSSDEIYDLPPKSYRSESEGCTTDEIYDFPPVVSANVTSDCLPPLDHGNTSRHTYVNDPRSVTVGAADQECNNMQRLTAQLSDSSEDYEVVVSSRTRSFKSSNSPSTAPACVEDDVMLPSRRHLSEEDTEDEDEDED